MIYAEPGTSFTAVLDANGDTGLVGTVTIQIENVDGTTHTAATTTGIVEVEDGIYSAVRTAPDTAATYIVVWNNAGTRAAEELIITNDLPSVYISSPAGGMTLLEMRTEVKARGFDEVGDARIDRWINRGLSRIYDRQSWPFLYDIATGPAPLTITDLRAVNSVRDTTNGVSLGWQDIRAIRDGDPGDDGAGEATSWYVDGETIAIYPASGATISVDYVKSGPDLVADDDETLLPARYDLLAVDAAVCEAYKDSDNLEAWQILRGDVDEQLAEMELAILVPNFDSADSIVNTNSSTDW